MTVVIIDYTIIIDGKNERGKSAMSRNRFSREDQQRPEEDGKIAGVHKKVFSRQRSVFRKRGERKYSVGSIQRENRARGREC